MDTLRSCALLIGAALLGAVVPLPAAAQGVDAIVHGAVKDITGAVVPGATVTLRDTESGIVQSSVTDNGGRYRMLPVPPGTYEVKAERTGFRPQIRTGQRLHVGMTVTIDITLETVTATESTDVAGTTQLLDSAKHGVARLVRREEIDMLPVIDRNFNGLAAMAPGVTTTGVYGGVDIGGSRDFQNGYNVDGVSAEGIGAGEPSARHRSLIQICRFHTPCRRAAVLRRSSGGV